MSREFRIPALIVFGVIVLMSGCARADGGATSAATSAATVESIETVEAQSAPQEEGDAAEALGTPNGTPDGTVSATLATGGGQTRGGGDLTTPTGNATLPSTSSTVTAATPGINITVLPTRMGQETTLPENASLLMIESLQSTTLASGQLVVEVNGTMVNDCRQPFIVQQSLMETTIYIQIYQIVPPETSCSRNILRYNENIPLAVPLTRGQVYTVDVNGLTLDITAP